MRKISTCLALVLLTGCLGVTETPVAPASRRSAPPARLVSATADLTGKVKAPASLLANNGAGLISDRGAGVISNNGGSWRVLAATPWVAADGLAVTLVSPAGKPQGGPVKTGKDGAFRFVGVPKGSSWIARVSLAGGGQLEALARAGEAEAAVSPASTVALAVARTRVASLETVRLSAIAALAAEVETSLQQDDALIDLADPLGLFARIAAARPAASAAADALLADPISTPAPGASPAAQASSAAQASPAVAPGAEIGPSPATARFATLPEVPVGLAAYGERVLVALAAARSVRIDTSAAMEEVAPLGFSPTAMAVAGNQAYLFNPAGGGFALYTLAAGKPLPTLTAGTLRKWPFSPAPNLPHFAVDTGGVILTNAFASNLKVSGGEPIFRSAVPGAFTIGGVPGGIRGAAASGPDTFWIGTGAERDNLYQLQEGKPIGTPITIAGPINDVAVAPDGSVYVATGNPQGGLIHVVGGVATARDVGVALDRVTVTASGAVRAVAGRDLYRW